MWRKGLDDRTSGDSLMRDPQIRAEEWSGFSCDTGLDIARELSHEEKSRTREEYDEKEDDERSDISEDDEAKQFEHYFV